jgi:MoaA/NifB/PqqE/SkfB family radical SAM enzyme
MVVFFDIKLGFTCNSNCIHCAESGKDKKGLNLTTQEIKDVIDSVSPEYVLKFNGGEPSIRPDLLELLKYAREIKRRFVWVYTNATGFTSDALAIESVKYMDSAIITIHSCDENTHERIAQTSGIWAKTIQGLRNILKYRVDCTMQTTVRTSTIISKLNIETLFNTLTFIQTIAPGTQMGLVYPHPVDNASKYADIILPRFADIKTILHKCIKQYRKYLYVRSIPKCILYPEQDNCFNQDDWLPSSQRPGFNPLIPGNGIIKDITLLDIQQKKKIPKCMECRFYSQCTGVWQRYIDLYKDSLDLEPIGK